MQISEDSWTELNKYLVHHDHGRISTAPQHVYAVVLSLVDPSAIRAGIATCDASGESTTWRVCAVTDRSLAFAEFEFDTRFYTGEEEREQQRDRMPTPKVTVHAAWVRPLGAIVEFAVNEVRLFNNANWCDVTATVKFHGVDEPVELPSQLRGNDDEQRSRSDAIVRHIRDAIG